MSRILVIDDNALLGNLLKEALEQESNEVAVALDANQGYAEAITFQPDLILLDVHLPDLLGFDLVNILKQRKELEHIPIIMITGSHLESSHKVRAFKSGVDDYITKPFEVPELLERVKAVLRRKQTHAEPARASSEFVSSRAPAIPAPPERKVLSLRETVVRAMLCPGSLSSAAFPPITLLYLAVLLGLSLGGWSLSSGSTVKPALIGLGMVGFWGLCVALLVMTSSIMGISLTWKEGARMVSLAGLPLLLKLLGGFVMTAATSLSPFYFTAGPALFLKTPSFLFQKLDVFELWMVWLIYVMVRERRDSSAPKAWAAAAVLWPLIVYWQSLWKY